MHYLKLNRKQESNCVVPSQYKEETGAFEKLLAQSLNVDDCSSQTIVTIAVSLRLDSAARGEPVVKEIPATGGKLPAIYKVRR